MVYLEDEDAKYAHWTPEECTSTCVGVPWGVGVLCWDARGGAWLVAGLWMPPPTAPPAPPRLAACRYCLEAHARAGMVVDTRAISDLLLDVLPPVLQGATVRELAPRHPWPSARHNAGSGLWWDVA